jgi:hypothetical protein
VRSPLLIAWFRFRAIGSASLLAGMSNNQMQSHPLTLIHFDLV